MNNITIDLGNVPSVLAALRDPQVAQNVANVAAESYNDSIHNWIDAGSAFKSTLGQLQQSINWRPLANGAEIYANASYAGYVERGTGTFVGHSSWVIRPRPGRKGLKIPVAGNASPVGPQMAGQGYILRREVIHPGSRPFPYFFADQDNRVNQMLQQARFVVNQAIAGA